MHQKLFSFETNLPLQWELGENNLGFVLNQITGFLLRQKIKEKEKQTLHLDIWETPFYRF